MTPLELRLRNFMSYRDEVTLDFSRLKVACFSGDNGSGKSALLDAITWAIWGKTRASSDRDVVAIGASEMEVTFVFALHDREYRVFRRRTAGSSSRQSLEFDVRGIGMLDWVTITGDNVRQTEKKIVETLNLDYETFVNSAFILQGRADSFAQIGPTDRKRILAEILNLSEYDALNQLARDEERGVRAALGEATQRLETLDRLLGERQLRMDDLERTAHLLNETAERLDRTDELLKLVSAQLAGWEQLRESLNSANARLGRTRSALQTLDEELQRLERERSARAELVERRTAIEENARNHRYWRAEAARFADLLLEVRAAEQECDTAEREIERAENDLRRSLDRLQQHARQLEEQEQAARREAEQLPDLETQERALAVAIARLPDVRDGIRAAAERKAALTSENAELKRRMEEIRDNIANVENGSGACPVCRAPLSPPDRLRIADEWRSEGKQLGNAYRANREEIAARDAEERRLREEETQLQAADRRYAQVLERKQRATNAATEVAEHAERRAALEAERNPLEQQLQQGSYALDARRRRAAAQEQLRALAYDRAAHDTAISSERAFAGWEERQQALERALIELEGVNQQVRQVTQQHAERAEEVRLLQAEVTALEAQLAGQPDLRKQADDLRDERDRLDFERSELQAQFGRAQGALEELDRLAGERDDVAERVRSLALDAGALKELVLAFGSNGIQTMIVESVLPEIEHEANDILRRMSSGALRVSFRSQREAVSSDRMIETLDIIIRDESGERPYALYSGGEAFRINFAVRVALSKLLAKRSGSRVDFLVIDEGFGSQDSRGRDGLIEALRSVEPDFGTIIVITHLSEIRELFPTRVEIAKTEAGSRLAIVDS